MDCAVSYFLDSAQLAAESGDVNATDQVKECKLCAANTTSWLLPVFVLLLLLAPAAFYYCVTKCRPKDGGHSLLGQLLSSADHIHVFHGTFVSLMTLHVKFLNQLFASNMLTWPSEFKRLLEFMNGIPREGCLLSSGYSFFVGW
jgi:hypothetical protein